ncbi:hypothetical protein [Brachybacterium subflavum]|uniref:hypothetical protein n=1 Tax=Brachybacterium subflavum TaxID=2585206 RepID=UPI00187A10CB|nr:hypothetical protein [Brachybacterium subflavum]
MDPLIRLAMWRELNSDRANAIAEARAAGHTWDEITEASGLSRAMAARIHQQNTAK